MANSSFNTSIPIEKKQLNEIIKPSPLVKPGEIYIKKNTEFSERLKGANGDSMSIVLTASSRSGVPKFILANCSGLKPEYSNNQKTPIYMNSKDFHDFHHLLDTEELFKDSIGFPKYRVGFSNSENSNLEKDFRASFYYSCMALF